jgi:hypothetical protein
MTTPEERVFYCEVHGTPCKTDTATACDCGTCTLTRRLEEARAALDAAQSALKFVCEREDYTFAECSLAEQIVNTCKDAFDIVSPALTRLTSPSEEGSPR